MGNNYTTTSRPSETDKLINAVMELKSLIATTKTDTDFVKPYTSPETDRLVQAMLQAQKSIDTVTVPKSNGEACSRILSIAKKALNDAGILITQYPVPTEQYDQVCLATKLVHVESGQWQLCVITLPVYGQSIEETMTCARKYALSNMLGIVVETDDRATSETDSDASQKSSATSSPKCSSLKAFLMTFGMRMFL